MATTKKPVKKAARPPIKMKMIDFTQEKVSAPVRKMVRLIDTEFKQQIRIANIPALRVMEKIINIDSFFLNHVDYEAILGPNVELLDRMMLSAICDVMANDIYESISDEKLNYVGVWDIHTLYSITAATVTFMKHDTTTEKYLTALQFEKISQEDLDKLPEGSYMPFSEYNSNRLFQQMINVRAMVLTTISGIIEKRMPKAFLASADKPLNYRLAEYYQNIMRTDIGLMMEQCKYTKVPETDPLYGTYALQPATEALIRSFTDYFEKPFMTFIALLMQESGLSQNIINMMLGMSRLHIFYDDPDGKTLGEIGIMVALTTEKSGLPNPTKVEFHITVRDATDMATLQLDQIAKKYWDIYGKPLRTFILDLCTYAINIYCDTMTMNKKDQPAESAYLNGGLSTSPVPDGVEDMDMEEMEKLLKGESDKAVETESV